MPDQLNPAELAAFLYKIAVIHIRSNKELQEWILPIKNKEQEKYKNAIVANCFNTLIKLYYQNHKANIMDYEQKIATVFDFPDFVSLHEYFPSWLIDDAKHHEFKLTNEMFDGLQNYQIFLDVKNQLLFIHEHILKKDLLENIRAKQSSIVNHWETYQLEDLYLLHQEINQFLGLNFPKEKDFSEKIFQTLQIDFCAESKYEHDWRCIQGTQEFCKWETALCGYERLGWKYFEETPLKPVLTFMPRLPQYAVKKITEYVLGFSFKLLGEENYSNYKKRSYQIAPNHILTVCAAQPTSDEEKQKAQKEFDRQTQLALQRYQTMSKRIKTSTEIRESQAIQPQQCRKHI